MSMLIKCDRCGRTDDAAIRMKEQRFEIKNNRPSARIELPQEIHLCAKCEEFFAYWIEKGRWEKVDSDG